MKEIYPNKHYDVIIIGGGISGLSSAALLSKAGLSCCLLEKDARPGGYLVGFDRKEYRFDSAIHWLNNCSEDGWVTKVFKIIGSDYPKAITQNKIKRFISPEFNYLVTSDPEELKEHWIQIFPEDKKGIIKFFRAAKNLSKSFDKYNNLIRTMDTMSWYEKPIYGLKMLNFAKPFIPQIRYTGEKGVIKGLKKYFSKPVLLSTFSSEPDLLSCLIPISWAYSKNYQTPPKGGSQRYPEWLSYAAKKMGCDLFFQSEATKIIIENNLAKGVEFRHKNKLQTIKANYIVAASDLESLYKKLLPQDIIPSKTIDALEKASLYSSALTISIALKCTAEELGLGEENIYLIPADTNRVHLGGGNPNESGIHILASSVRDKSLAPKGKGTLTIFIPAWIENHNYWGCKLNEDGEYERGPAYQKIKNTQAEIIIQRVQDELIPKLKDNIAFFEVATPITHLRYTGNKNGSMMGQKPGKENMQNKVASYRTPIKNLLLSGHWADLGGGMPIAIKSALNTSLIILKQENPKVFKLLAAYADGKIGTTKLISSDLLKKYDNSWEPEPSPAQKTTDSTDY